MQIQIGDKIVEAEIKNGIPVIKGEVEKTINANGGVDVTVKVPCLKLSSKKEN